MERIGTADGSSNKIIITSPARASATSNNQAGVSATGSKNNETKSATTAADQSKKKAKTELKSEMRPERCIPTDRKITQHAQIP